MREIFTEASRFSKLIQGQNSEVEKIQNELFSSLENPRDDDEGRLTAAMAMLIYYAYEKLSEAGNDMEQFKPKVRVYHYNSKEGENKTGLGIVFESKKAAMIVTAGDKFPDFTDKESRHKVKCMNLEEYFGYGYRTYLIGNNGNNFEEKVTYFIKDNMTRLKNIFPMKGRS